MGNHTSVADENFRISPKYRADDWRKLDLTKADSPDWPKAVAIFYDRIYGRFLAPVEAIENHRDRSIKWFSGFAILAIDCLIIETLYQFYNGVDETDIKHREAFWHFFRASTHFKPHFPQNIAYKFYSHFRCGILHQAQTKMSSKVRAAEDKMVQLVDSKDINQGLIIDRKRFHQALCDEIDEYANRLKNPQSAHDYDLREKFKDKMSFIVK